MKVMIQFSCPALTEWIKQGTWCNYVIRIKVYVRNKGHTVKACAKYGLRDKQVDQWRDIWVALHRHLLRESSSYVIIVLVWVNIITKMGDILPRQVTIIISLSTAKFYSNGSHLLLASSLEQGITNYLPLHWAMSNIFIHCLFICFGRQLSSVCVAEVLTRC